MKKSFFFKIFASIAIILLLIFTYTRFSAKDVVNHAPTGKAIIADLIQRVTIAGNIVPLSRTVITAPFNGHVRKLFVKVGAKIKKGDPLVTIAQSLQSNEQLFPLRSPLSGTVVSVNKQEGEYVKQEDAQDYILRIDDMSELFISSNVSELDMVKIKIGLTTIIKVSALLDKEYEGIVQSIDLASIKQDGWNEGSKVEYNAKIKILNPDEFLRPGMSTIIDLVTLKKEKTLILPYEYILKEEGKYFVTLLSGERKEIEVGLQNETYFEILKGLSAGEEVQQIDFLTLLTKKTGK